MITRKEFEEGNVTTRGKKARLIVDFLNINYDHAYTGKDLTYIDVIESDNKKIYSLLKSLVQQGQIIKKGVYYAAK